MEHVKFQTLVDMQEKACQRYADNRLFGTRRGGRYEWMSYREFAGQVDRFRAALAALGVRRGDKVAVIANNRVEWAVGAYATYGLGAHYVPMYEAQLPKEWRFILEDSGAVVLLVSSEEIYDRTKGFAGKVGQLREVICMDAPASAPYSWQCHMAPGAHEPVPSIQPDPEEVAGLIYTSGTTGEPKGVVLSHANIVSNINAVHECFPIYDSDVSLSFLPWAHSFGQTCELHVLLSYGAAIGLAESVQTLVQNLGEVQPTILFSVPRIFNRIYDGLHKRMEEEGGLRKKLFYHALGVARARRELAARGRRSLWLELQHALLDRLVFAKVRARLGGRLRFTISGGAALSREVAEFISDVGIQVYEGYGLTETSPIVSTNRPGAVRIGTVGKPIPGVEVLILDEEQRPLPQGEDGEICVIGPNIMQGYHNRPEATAEVIFEYEGRRCFRTGDMGHLDPDGFLVITGRIKEQYKLENGKYVVPAPLEEKLKLSGLINQAFIYGDNKPYNVALVVPDEEAVRKWARQRGLPGADGPFAELIQRPEVHARIGEELQRFAQDFKGYERPQRWALIAEEFSTDNDLLTPTLKIKRRNIIKRYQELIERLYSEEPARAA